MIDADIAAQVLGNNTSSSPGMTIDPDIAAHVLGNSSAVSPFMSGVAGFNKQFETLPANIASLGAKALGYLDKESAGAEDAVKKFYADRANSYQQDINQNPKAGLAGEIAGGIAESAPEYAFRAATLPAKAIQGGIAGYTGTDPNASPIAKGVNTLASAGLNMLPGGAALSTVAGGAAGAGYGYATDGDMAKDALVGAGTGLSAYAGGKAIGVPLVNIVRSIKPALTTPSDLADVAIQKTLEKVGGDMSKATPEMAFNEFDRVKQAAQVRKNELYSQLNTQANQEGVSVSKDNLSGLVDDLTNQVKQGATSDTAQTLREAKRLLGTPQKQTTSASAILDTEGNPLTPGSSTTQYSPMSYEKAYSLVSDVGKKINTAVRQGDNALADKLTPVKNALLADIKAGGGSDALQSLKTQADDFYKNVYNPLRDIGAKDILENKFAEGKFLGTALKSVTQSPAYLNAFRTANKEGITNQAEQLMQAGYVNALKDAATTDGLINPKTFANSLSKTLKDNPTPFSTIADRMRVLGDALDVAQEYQGMRAGLSQHSVGQKVALGLMTAGASGGFIAGGIPGAMVGAASYFLPKTKFLMAAGKMLKNPDTAALLDRAAKISDNTDPSVANTVMDYVRLAARKAGMEVPYSNQELAKGLNTAKIKVADTHAATGGSTFSMDGSNMIGSKKYSVSVFPDRGTTLDGGSVTSKDIENFVSQNKDLFRDPKVAISTWFDKETNKTYIDAVLTLDNKNDALQLAQKYNQKAIFNLHNLQEIPAGGTGEAGNYTTKATARIPRDSNTYGKIIGRVTSSVLPVLDNQ